MAVCNAGGFSAAARALGVSTSHVSRAVAQLEARAGARLLYRTTRRITLTDAGYTFFDRCRAMIEAREQALAQVGETGGAVGHIRLTCATAFGERFIAPAVAKFLDQQRGVSVSIELTNRVLDLVGEGYDLAIRTGELVDSRLVATRVGSRRHYLCAAPDYLRQAGAPRTVADLKDHACILGTADVWRFSVGGNTETFKPAGRFRCNSGNAVVEAARRGLGLCQLPEFYVLPLLQAGALSSVLEAYQPDPEPIWAVYPHRELLPVRVRLLIETLRRELHHPFAA